MKNKLRDIMVNAWSCGLITIVTLGMVGIIIFFTQWILKLVGVL